LHFFILTLLVQTHHVRLAENHVRLTVNDNVKPEIQNLKSEIKKPLWREGPNAHEKLKKVG
jgi:hypothetical protein